ncbi:hypothetical protein CYMTET_2963 [Cymbomonas tetramitiformis]|uniref:Uncharacterized protein n=1 Tax=Cymbomonas tetramitiformis TaxID=36881 RepID=A0AAE0H421_9CHLO|nr:hypothetical protein CYMTET_2963 [Cymbomonas tetramitiformis]
MNHQKPLAVFKDLAEGMFTTPGQTRMGTIFYAYESMKKHLDATTQTLVSSEVVQYVRANASQKASPESPTLMQLYNEAKGFATDPTFDIALAFAERSLLHYKLKRGTWARDTVWLNAQQLASPDFWFLNGSDDPESQLVAMRACGQVSGAGSAKRGHKVMNCVEKDRNSLDFDNVEAWIYVKHNSGEIDKREKLSYDPKLIPWTDGVDPNAEWVDAWQEDSC